MHKAMSPAGKAHMATLLDVIYMIKISTMVIFCSFVAVS